ncbi:MAG: hypothetical protein WC852_07875 [Candidatus Nanoarchaeia archaeon]
MVLKPSDANEKLENILTQAAGSIQYDIDDWLVAMGMARGYEEGLRYPMPEKLTNSYVNCPRAESFTLSRSAQNNLADRLLKLYQNYGWNVSKEEETIKSGENTFTKVYLHFKRR